MQGPGRLPTGLWKGPLPVFEVDLGWAYSRFHTIFGRFTYLGKPIFGFGTGANGRPTDSYTYDKEKLRSYGDPSCG